MPLLPAILPSPSEPGVHSCALLLTFRPCGHAYKLLAEHEAPCGQHLVCPGEKTHGSKPHGRRSLHGLGAQGPKSRLESAVVAVAGTDWSVIREPQQAHPLLQRMGLAALQGYCQSTWCHSMYPGT